jgi:hypothetical protein
MRDSDGSTGEEDEILGITRLNKRIVPVTPFSPGATHVGRKKWISLMSASVENDRDQPHLGPHTGVQPLVL